MEWRVFEDEDARWHLDAGLDQFEDPTASGDEILVVDEAALDVLVATDGEEVVLLVVLERPLLA